MRALVLLIQLTAIYCIQSKLWSFFTVLDCSGSLLLCFFSFIWLLVNLWCQKCWHFDVLARTESLLSCEKILSNSELRLSVELTNYLSSRWFEGLVARIKQLIIKQIIWIIIKAGSMEPGLVFGLAVLCMLHKVNVLHKITWKRRWSMTKCIGVMKTFF